MIPSPLSSNDTGGDRRHRQALPLDLPAPPRLSRPAAQVLAVILRRAILAEAEAERDTRAA